jgi:hypothetical protein
MALVAPMEEPSTASAAGMSWYTPWAEMGQTRRQPSFRHRANRCSFSESRQRETTPPRRGPFWGVVLGRHRQMVIDDVLGILDEAIQPRPVPLKQNGGERERRTRRKDQDFRTGSMGLHRQPVATIFDDLGHCPKSNFVRVARMIKSRGNLSQAGCLGATTALRSTPGARSAVALPVARFLDREVLISRATNLLRRSRLGA